jgi:E3 Ubiquitin ligase
MLHVSGQHPPPYPFIAAGAALLAIFALYRFFVRLRRERLVADTPAVRIRSAAQGYVKVHGQALPASQQPTAAPLSSRPCVWWSYEIAHQERDSKGNTHWRTVDSASSVELFVLADEDARCLVGPVKAEITPTVRDVWYGSASWPTNGPPVGGSGLFHSSAWRYTERLLGVGERVCVMGELRSHSETGANVDAAAAALLHEWKNDQGALLARFDADHDGRLDATEWEAARQAAIREVQAQALKAPVSRVSVIAEPTNGEPFLIASLNDTQLVSRERRFAALDFALGLLGVIVCAWALVHLG